MFSMIQNSQCFSVVNNLCRLTTIDFSFIARKQQTEKAYMAYQDFFYS